MKPSTITKISAALTRSPLGSFTERELVDHTGLSRATITNAIRQLNLIRSSDWPRRYSLPVGGLRSVPVDKQVSNLASWHRPISRRGNEQVTDPKQAIPNWKQVRGVASVTLDKVDFGSCTREEIETVLDTCHATAELLLTYVATIDKAMKAPDWADKLGIDN